MDWLKTHWLKLAIAAGLLLAAALFIPLPANAADLGGNCCADLEERIAELEATTARKGNKKVSLRVYGQVNTALTYIETDGFDDTRITQNGVDESFVAFDGAARISNTVSAGYVMSLDLRDFGLGGQQQSLEINTRESFWYIKSDVIGSLRMGKTSNATNDFDKVSVANTAVATRPLSLQPLSDPYLAGVDLPFDGGYRNVVRYDSPDLAGFVASASWGASGLTSSGDTGDMWDVALRYRGEFSQIAVAGAVGYRVDEGQEIAINLAGINLAIPTGSETKTFLASGSAMHVPTGIFLNAYYADQQWDDGFADGLDLQMLQVQGGVEFRAASVGKTTVFAEYGDLEIDLGGNSLSPTMFGLGVVQAVDAAAMDFYLTYRLYDLDDVADDISVITAGARISF